MEVYKSPNEECIEKLTELLEEAKKGEMLTITGVYVETNQVYTSFSSRCLDRRMMAGTLLNLAVTHLGFKVDDE